MQVAGHHFERQVVALVHDDECARLLAQPRVGHSDDRDRADPRVLDEHILDLASADVQTAADDDVLDPAAHPHVPGLVDVAEVAGLREPVGRVAEFGLLGIPVVAEHERRTTEGDIPLLADRHLGIVGADDLQHPARNDAAV